MVGTVGYGQLGRDGALPIVPASGYARRATIPRPPPRTTTDSLDQPGALPLVTEWTRALGLTGTARLTPVKPFEAVECLDAAPGAKVQQEGLTLDAGGSSGGQVRFALASGTDPAAASGDRRRHRRVRAGGRIHGHSLAAPRRGTLYSYTAGDAGPAGSPSSPGRRRAVLQIVDPDHPTSIFTQSRSTSLADVAQQRLARYGTGTDPPSHDRHPSGRRPSTRTCRSPGRPRPVVRATSSLPRSGPAPCSPGAPRPTTGKATPRTPPATSGSSARPRTPGGPRRPAR